MGQRCWPRHVVNIGYLVAVENQASDQRLTQPFDWQGAHYVVKFSVTDEAPWQMQAAAGVAQLRLNRINDESEPLLAALQLLRRSFYFARRGGSQGRQGICRGFSGRGGLQLLEGPRAGVNEGVRARVLAGCCGCR